MQCFVLWVVFESLDGRTACQVELEHIWEAGKVGGHGSCCLHKLGSCAILPFLDMHMSGDEQHNKLGQCTSQ